MSHFQLLFFDFDEPTSRGVFYGDREKTAKKGKFSHLDEARDQLVRKTYSKPATTSSLFFSLSNETKIIKIEPVLDRATIHGTGELLQKHLRVYLMGLSFRFYTAYKKYLVVL